MGRVVDHRLRTAHGRDDQRDPDDSACNFRRIAVVMALRAASYS